MVQLKPSSTSETIGAIAPLYSLSWLESCPNTCKVVLTLGICSTAELKPAWGAYRKLKRENVPYLVVVKGPAHMLACNTLH